MMSINDPNNQILDGRHIRLVDERQNAPLLSLTQDAGGHPDPKFLGFCCGPATSSCCGCSLQFSLKAFATIALVFGALGVVGSLVSIGLTDVLSSVQSLFKCGLLFALGILLWNTAGEVNPRLGRLSSYILAGIYVLDVVAVILFIASIASPSFKAKVMEGFHNEFVKEEHREPTDEEMEGLRTLVNVIVGTLIGSTTVALLFEGLLYLFVYYFIWSFIVRAKRGEYFVLAYGPSAVSSVATPVLNPQYGAYYPQMIAMPPSSAQQPPMVYPPPYYYYQQQSPQVQLSNMQQPQEQAVDHQSNST